MFNWIKKLFVNTPVVSEDVVEVKSVEPVLEAPKKTSELKAMTKKQLEEYGRTIGLELDRRLTKAKLIEIVEKAQ